MSGKQANDLHDDNRPTEGESEVLEEQTVVGENASGTLTEQNQSSEPEGPNWAQRLPDVVVLIVFAYLSTRDLLLNVSLTCKRFAALAKCKSAHRFVQISGDGDLNRASVFMSDKTSVETLTLTSDKWPRVEMKHFWRKVVPALENLKRITVSPGWPVDSAMLEMLNKDPARATRLVSIDSPADHLALDSWLRNPTSLRYLKLDNWQLLARLALTTTSLETLILDGSLADASIKLTCDSIRANSGTLTRVEFRRGCADDELISAIACCANLATLVLNVCEISAESLRSIGRLTKLKSLDICIVRVAASEVCDFVSSLKTLTSLKIIYEGSDDRIMSALAKLETLQTLIFSSGFSGSVSDAAFVELYSRCSNLETFVFFVKKVNGKVLHGHQLENPSLKHVAIVSDDDFIEREAVRFALNNTPLRMIRYNGRFFFSDDATQSENTGFVNFLRNL